MQPLTGLIICGGQSSRMGRDKSLINYHGQQQRYHEYQMLEPFCKKVFISCNKEQAAAVEENYSVMVDDETYGSIGPMAGLLTAVSLYPNHSFIVIGCDYPFLEKENLKQLVEARNADKKAVAFFNEQESLYEPLLCIYEKEIIPAIISNYQQDNYSLQSVLQQAGALKLVPSKPTSIKSIDTPEQYESAIKELLLLNSPNTSR